MADLKTYLGISDTDIKSVSGLSADYTKTILGSKLNYPEIIDSAKNTVIYNLGKTLNESSVPAASDFDVLSSNLFIDDFTDDRWTIRPGWTIENGKLKFLDTDTDYVQISIGYFKPGTKLVIDFFVSDLVSDISLRFQAQGNYVFSGYTAYTSGLNTIEITVPDSADILAHGLIIMYIYCNKYSSHQFSIDYFRCYVKNTVSSVSISGKVVSLTCNENFASSETWRDNELKWYLNYTEGVNKLQYSNLNDVGNITWLLVKNKIEYTRLTILGDSIDRGFQYPCLYDRSVYKIINRSVPGAAIISTVDAAKMSLQISNVANNEADICTLKFGTNDNNAGDMSAIEAELNQQLTYLKNKLPNAKLYYVNVLPCWTDVSGGTEKDKSNIRASIKTVIDNHGDIVLVDSYNIPWIEAGDTSDGTHLNSTGRTKVHSNILKSLNKGDNLLSSGILEGSTGTLANFIDGGVNFVATSSAGGILLPRIKWLTLSAGTYLIQVLGTTNSGSANNTLKIYCGTSNDYLSQDVAVDAYYEHEFTITDSEFVFIATDGKNNTFDVDLMIALRKII